jgi:hypothetical protein
MGKPQSHVMTLEDFPEQFQELVIPDVNEGRRGYLRIGHYIIAGEILEQILTRRLGDIRTRRISQESRHIGLSKQAMINLKDFCVEFIKDVTKRTSRTRASQAVVYILTKTFIYRDNEEVSDDLPSKRKPMFSPIMTDLDNIHPYNGRLEVLEELCSSCPDDPNLTANMRAHLGRFYSICRPEEESKIDNNFKEALRLCRSLQDGRCTEDMDDRLKQTLQHVYHMCGVAYQRRIAKYTGWNPGDEMPATRNLNLADKLEEVVRNAETASFHFSQARIVTTEGSDDSFVHLNEIQVRLQACEFINRFYPGHLQAFLARTYKKKSDEFIRDSVTVIEDLIMECYSLLLVEKNAMLRQYVNWYYALFNDCTEQLKKFIQGDDLASLKLQISRQKLKFHGKDCIVAVENPEVPKEVIESMVNTLENILRSHQNSQVISKRMLDLYYKDWIFAIRNPAFLEVRIFW